MPGSITRPPMPGTCVVHCQLPALCGTGTPLPALRSAAPARAAAPGSRRNEPRSNAGWNGTAPPKRLLHAGLAGCAAASLVGCAGFVAPAAPVASPQVTPLLRIQDSGSLADALYAAGKRALELGQPAIALQRFEQAATARPAWADPHNGRVVAMARLGRIDDALRTAREAIAAHPTHAELAWNLGLLQERAEAERRPAAPAIAGAGPTRGAPDSTQVATSERSVHAAAAERQASPVGASWRRSGPHVMELVAAPVASESATWVPPRLPERPPQDARTEPRDEAADLPAAQPATAARLDVPSAPVPPARAAAQPRARLRLEICNGAGRENLARTIAMALKPAGLTAARLTNHENFRMRQTEIRYRGADQLAAARALAAALALPVSLRESSQLRADIDLKLVLGSDAARQAARARPILQPSGADTLSALLASAD